MNGLHLKLWTGLIAFALSAIKRISQIQLFQHVGIIEVPRVALEERERGPKRHRLMKVFRFLKSEERRDRERAGSIHHDDTFAHPIRADDEIGLEEAKTESGAGDEEPHPRGESVVGEEPRRREARFATDHGRQALGLIDWRFVQ